MVTSGGIFLYRDGTCLIHKSETHVPFKVEAGEPSGIQNENPSDLLFTQDLEVVSTSGYLHYPFYALNGQTRCVFMVKFIPMAHYISGIVLLYVIEMIIKAILESTCCPSNILYGTQCACYNIHYKPRITVDEGQYFV